MEDNLITLHNKYVNKGIRSLKKIDFSQVKKGEIIELLQTNEQEYINSIKSLPKKQIDQSEAQEKKLISFIELKKLLTQHIAEKVLEDKKDIHKIATIDQLVTKLVGGEADYLSKELVDTLEDQKKLEPNIEGSVENIKKIILPPDTISIITGSGTGRKNKSNEIIVDKIGLVEERLAKKLNQQRSDFHWKKGILQSNQMRKQSYYCLYIPQLNKTLLLNNQYGEGCFIIDGDFNIREARKSDIKGTLGTIALAFDYKNPNNFLDILDRYINRNIILETSNNINSSNHVENQTNKQEFIHFFHSLSPEEQNIITTSHASYPKRAKDKDNIPKSYRGLIPLLGGDNTCTNGDYVKALIQSEEDGKKYFDNWLIQKEIPQLNKQEFIHFFHSLSPEEQTTITSNTSSYLNRAKDKNNIPKTYKGLITLLGGNNTCQHGGYVKALIESEEDGKKYFDNWLIQKEIQLTKEEFIHFFHSLSLEEQNIVTSNNKYYLNRAKDKNNIPKTHRGLITLLGGNNKCEQGGYVKALLQSEHAGKKYFDNWLIQKEIQLTKEEFIQFFHSLSLEEQNIVTSNNIYYLNRVKDKNNIPKTYKGLITLLGGNNTCQQGGYVKALLQSEHAGKKYFDKRNQKK